MDETIVTFSVQNLITVTIMGFVGFAILGAVMRALQKRNAGAAQ